MKYPDASKFQSACDEARRRVSKMNPEQRRALHAKAVEIIYRKEPQYYCVLVDGVIATNCQRDPLVYFRRRDAITHAERECVRDCVAVMKPRKIKIVRVRIEVEK